MSIFEAKEHVDFLYYSHATGSALAVTIPIDRTLAVDRPFVVCGVYR